ncbi:MAG: hypothetical protein AB2792_16595 [Candidatus Thiodiazotropha sp.]
MDSQTLHDANNRIAIAALPEGSPKSKGYEIYAPRTPINSSKAVLFTLLFCLISTVTVAVDDENCLMCHKMPGLGIYIKDEKQNAVKRIFYINEELFKASYHGRLPCTSCHQGVNEIPHDTTERVDCASDCHIQDPSNNSKFSHADIVLDFSTSAHGMQHKIQGPQEDLPTCKYCHSNKPYQLSDSNHQERVTLLKICMQCHGSEAWTERFFKHINYRTMSRRTSKQIVELCSQCHADQAMMDNHELDVVIGFNDTFHGKAIRYGNTDVANCLSCHAPYQYGFSPHSILSQRQHNSPVSNKNKIETCRQAGCHTEAKEEFATSGRIHPSSLTPAKMASRKSPHRADEEVPDTEFQEWVLHMIALFYKALIIVVVGALAIHQFLELLTLRRERKIKERG